LAAGDNYRRVVLLPGVLRVVQNALLIRRQRVVAVVAAGVRVLRVVQFLGDQGAAIGGLDLSLPLHLRQDRVVVFDVVRELAGLIDQRRRDDLAYIDLCHKGMPSLASCGRVLSRGFCASTDEGVARRRGSVRSRPACEGRGTPMDGTPAE